MLCRLLCFVLLLLSPIQVTFGYELNVDDSQSIRDVSQKVAYKMMQFYAGNLTGQIPGLFGDPYYWWEAGAAFGALIDYWYYTGDAGYIPVTMEAMLHQVGPDNNYMPPNQSKSLGNDDQAFWAHSAMSAAEKKFPDPPKGQPQWLSLAQAVFNTQAARWDDEHCRGGLRWQIYTFNNGYHYKNTVSNGAFFLLASRLARYTGNSTYMDWAVKTWDWTRNIGLMSDDYKLYDGYDINDGCTKVQPIQWTYNAGLYLAGAAYLYNYTDGDSVWASHIDGILRMTQVFFPDGIMSELACEPYMTCNVDQRSFKAYLSRFMALTVKMAPYTRDIIMPKLRSSAEAAARHCSFGEDQNTCGLRWTEPEWENLWGVGEQLSALETIQSNLILGARDYVTEKKGGTSKGNPSAGTGGETVRERSREVGTKDKGGAAALTAGMAMGFVVLGIWMSW
ncbi:mannan endo-1,6-alpha-mannosidase [Wilcoxina mikolae CBS 423.85]|nr:mannan endo-1,6-alpha-mannosidase [Wilcoxina mikolae CBS 423.85]